MLGHYTQYNMAIYMYLAQHKRYITNCICSCVQANYSFEIHK